MWRIGGMKMQVANVTGIKGMGTKPQIGTATKEQRTGRKETVPEKTARRLKEAEGATVDISAKGLGLAREETEENASVREKNEKQMYQDMLENAKEASEAQGEGFGDLARAMEIARRILNGDIVPAQDEKFLMEFNSEMYMRVKSMAELKEDPEKYDSLLEEEDEDAKRSGSGSPASVRGSSGTEEAKTDDGAAASGEAEGPESGEAV